VVSHNPSQFVLDIVGSRDCQSYRHGQNARLPTYPWQASCLLSWSCSQTRVHSHLRLSVCPSPLVEPACSQSALLRLRPEKYLVAELYLDRRSRAFQRICWRCHSTCNRLRWRVSTLYSQCSANYKDSRYIQLLSNVSLSNAVLSSVCAVIITSSSVSSFNAEI
jgi:hypothetical protein